jgi:hypothetical protein
LQDENRELRERLKALESEAPEKALESETAEK